MTILIGVKFEDSVLFLADTLTNSLNEIGEVKEVLWSDSQKVRKVRKEVAIATAGLGSLGHSVTDVIGAIISNESPMKKEEITSLTKDTLTYALSNFNKYNPEAPYSKLAAILGGIDDFTREPYLFEYHSDNNFTTLSKDVAVLGVQPEAENIRKQIVQMLKDYPGHDPFIYANNFAIILREVTKNSVHVGEEVFVTLIKNDGNSGYQYFDKTGESIPIPQKFHCT
ncbi:hypothetical protein D3C75_318970 [compost metagenome]